MTEAAATASTSNNNNDNTNTIIPGKTRLQDDDGFMGTILYVGPVASASAKNAKEIYAGVIWDDPSRGKHDGSVICRTTNRLVRHFHCPHPCGASFLKLAKVNLGVSLNAQVMREKYVTKEAPIIAPNNRLPHTIKTSTGKEKPIELYGELQVRQKQQLDHLNAISLRRMGIARYEGADLSEFSHLQSLDLATNLLSDWNTVLEILKQFPNLTHFSVAANRLQDPTLEIQQEKEKAPFQSLQILNVNQCEIQSANTLLWIAKLFPNLQDLCIAHANLSDLSSEMIQQQSKFTTMTGAAATDTLLFRHIQKLDLTACQLTSWEHQIVPLCSQLPVLEQLSLDDNPIEVIETIHQHYSNDAAEETSKEEQTTIYFPQLTSLQLAGTNIQQWTDLDGLLQLPLLNSLRFRRCPLLASLGTGEARSITIARLPNLTKLNASEISEKQRTEAERRYISTVAFELLQLSQQQQQQQQQQQKETNEKEQAKEKGKQEFLQQHCQFERLMEQHKEFIATRTQSMNYNYGFGNGSNNTTANKDDQTATMMVVVNVSIQSMAPSSCHMEPLLRRLPGSLTIKRLKAMCARTFQLDPDLQRLHFATDDAFPTALDDEEHTLAYYGVPDGATIYMKEVDAKDLAAQQQQTQQELEDHIQQQEALEMQKQKYKQQLLQS